MIYNCHFRNNEITINETNEVINICYRITEQTVNYTNKPIAIVYGVVVESYLKNGDDFIFIDRDGANGLTDSLEKAMKIVDILHRNTALPKQFTEYIDIVLEKVV
ncbi:MAG: DUF6514 family protein [Defluviitaleaceae bacterium]|nr:DUF6514 family protein [Defluviitaleaceae bacterium]